MIKEKLRPVYMVYPGLYPLLMFNYWVKTSGVPVVGIMLSGYDTKYKGRVLSFQEELGYFLGRSGWAYSLYILCIAKLGVGVVSLWNSIRRLLGKKVKIKTFEEIAQERGIPIYKSNDFNSKESLNFIKNVGANIIVSAYNNQILKSGVIKYPKYGTINIHPGCLPDFRGIDAVFEAMYQRVKKAGVTVHYVDTKIDNGDIIAQDLLLVHKRDTLFSLNVRLWMHGAWMLNRVFKMIEESRVIGRKQEIDKIKYPYCSYPVKERLKAFEKNGRRLFRFKDLLNTLK